MMARKWAWVFFAHREGGRPKVKGGNCGPRLHPAAPRGALYPLSTLGWVDVIVRHLPDSLPGGTGHPGLETLALEGCFPKAQNLTKALFHQGMDGCPIAGGPHLARGAAASCKSRRIRRERPSMARLMPWARAGAVLSDRGSSAR